MPYKKKRNTRRSGAHSRYSNAGRYLDTASKALAVAYAVKKLVNVEYRRKATNFTVDPNITGAVVALTDIAQGDGITNRQGNKIRCKRIACSGIITLNASAADTQTRLVIVRDNNGSTTRPTITDLYGTVVEFSDNFPKTGDPQSNSRFTVLMDKMIIVNTDTPTKQLNWSQTLDHHIYFTGATATDEGKGHLYLFIASNENPNDPVVAVQSQVWYIDN